MKVLLTGASGFVGSHILDALRARDIPAAILLRPSSNRRFIKDPSHALEIRLGSIADPSSLKQALTEITHLIHCAGCTKARANAEFYEVNQTGTHNVVEAANACGVERLVHISSLAVTGPATVLRPVQEDDPAHPISEYGKSKLAGESEVLKHCRAAFTILRPPAVYGPRDQEFLPMFRAVKRRVLPRPSAAQALSVVYVGDLAQAVVRCLNHSAAAGRTYFVASPEIITARAMAEEIASQLKVWAVPCPLPPAFLWMLCVAEELISRATGKPMLLNLQKFAELRAPAWTCNPARLRTEIGFECPTSVKQGIAETLRWYQDEHWL